MLSRSIFQTIFWIINILMINSSSIEKRCIKLNISVIPATTSTIPATTSTIPATTLTIPATTSIIPATTSTIPATTLTIPATTSTIPATTLIIPATTSTIPATTLTIPATTSTIRATTSTIPATTSTIPATTSTIRATTSTIRTTTSTIRATTSTIRATTSTIPSKTKTSTTSTSTSTPKPVDGCKNPFNEKECAIYGSSAVEYPSDGQRGCKVTKQTSNIWCPIESAEIEYSNLKKSGVLPELNKPLWTGMCYENIDDSNINFRYYCRYQEFKYNKTYPPSGTEGSYQDDSCLYLDFNADGTPIYTNAYTGLSYDYVCLYEK